MAGAVFGSFGASGEILAIGLDSSGTSPACETAAVIQEFPVALNAVGHTDDETPKPISSSSFAISWEFLSVVTLAPAQLELGPGLSLSGTSSTICSNE
jgi:hypothetical protein